MNYVLSFMRFLNSNYTKTHLYLVTLILLSIVGLIVYQINSGPAEEEVKYYQGTVTQASGDVVVFDVPPEGFIVSSDSYYDLEIHPNELIVEALTDSGTADRLLNQEVKFGVIFAIGRHVAAPYKLVYLEQNRQVILSLEEGLDSRFSWLHLCLTIFALPALMLRVSSMTFH
ncbi:hypothetical protein BCT11_10795 [Vibrio sp. 10N.222.52.B12]|uniref:hypothetical protein n=1 Tax=Vibrio sp. 10N.222.52.B12 TaxID=1880840 RepID=UPI000C84288E|nr:hypothetical protein [Vibrio sp. 10N.222.52.B12]PMO42296.1 hypothetical protein BCT11_10795 [Vibrio sp. 10N.222.52.B12]